jgi:type I restriction enzyme S subunit
MSVKTVDEVQVDLSKLPPVPTNWKWCIPMDCCSTIASGGTPNADLMYAGKGEVPIIKVYNLTDYGFLDFSVKPTFIDRSTHFGQLARSRVFPGDVLINIVGPPLGKVAIVPNDYPEWNINQAIVLFRPLNGISNRYLAFAFMTDSIMRRVTSLAKATAGQFNIGVGMCRRLLPIPISPNNEQRRIVAKIEELFSDLDAGVAALERARANLKRYRASVLKAAVEGKLTAEWRARNTPSPGSAGEGGRRPGEGIEPASKLLERILAERRKKWESDQLAKYSAQGKQPPKGWKEKYVEPKGPDTSALPELPGGWCWANVGQLVAEGPQNGVYYPKAKYGSGVAIIRIDDYQQFGSRCNTALQLVEVSADDRVTFGLAANDVLLNRVNSVTHLGKVLLVESRHLPAVFESNMMRLRFCDAELASYLRDYLRSFIGTRRLIKNAKWAVNQASINQQDVQATPVPVPPLDEQVQIVIRVAEKLSQIEAAELAIDHGLMRAARLRQSILKRAFEGKLVPQDPNDEPAGEMLGRVALGSNHKGTGKAVAAKKKAIRK